MMKAIMIAFTWFLMPVNLQSPLYEIHFSILGGADFTMASLEGKVIVIVPVEGAAKSVSLLKTLDSLQKTVPMYLSVLAVPATDLDSTITESSLIELQNSLGLGLVIGQPAAVKKSAGINQHPLFKWLTDMNENTHFDRDVEEVGQCFITNKQGTLYAILGGQSSIQLLKEVISAPTGE